MRNDRFARSKIRQERSIQAVKKKIVMASLSRLQRMGEHTHERKVRVHPTLEVSQRQLNKGRLDFFIQW